jgi:hypothetical protein
MLYFHQFLLIKYENGTFITKFGFIFRVKNI